MGGAGPAAVLELLLEAGTGAVEWHHCALLAVMPRLRATPLTGCSSRSTRRIISAYSGFRTGRSRVMQAQTSPRNSSS